MKNFLRVIAGIFTPKSPTMLGRWGITHKESVIKHKVYWANEDNCGPCGFYLKKYKDKKVTISDEK